MLIYTRDGDTTAPFGFNPQRLKKLPRQQHIQEFFSQHSLYHYHGSYCYLFHQVQISLNLYIFNLLVYFQVLSTVSFSLTTIIDKRGIQNLKQFKCCIFHFISGGLEKKRKW